MILATKTFRLSPLSVLDDLQEEKTEDVTQIGRTVFVSSWTDDSKESIPMWNMYKFILQKPIWAATEETYYEF